MPEIVSDPQRDSRTSVTGVAEESDARFIRLVIDQAWIGMHTPVQHYWLIQRAIFTTPRFLGPAILLSLPATPEITAKEPLPRAA